MLIILALFLLLLILIDPLKYNNWLKEGWSLFDLFVRTVLTVRTNIVILDFI